MPLPRPTHALPAMAIAAALGTADAAFVECIPFGYDVKLNPKPMKLIKANMSNPQTFSFIANPDTIFKKAEYKASVFYGGVSDGYDNKDTQITLASSVSCALLPSFPSTTPFLIAKAASRRT